MEKYDIVSDVDGRFSEEFKNYVRGEKLVCMRWRHFYNYLTLFWVFQKEQELDSVSLAYRHLTDKMMLLSNTTSLQNCLIQFWKAEEVVNSDVGEMRFLLTTRNQPFIIWDHPVGELCEGICSYRMRTRDVITTRIGRGGAISRVFQNNRMECTPHVLYYSSEEYPKRDMALSCQIESSLIAPLSDSSGCSIGVVELVSQLNGPIHFMDGFISSLPERDCCKGLCGQYDLEKDSLNIAVSEIRDVIEVVWECCNLELIQTWILCSVCNSLSTSDKCGDGLHASKADWFGKKSSFLEIEYYHILRKGEGIVGKASTLSHNAVYCEDVAKYNIIEYPLAHFACKHNLSACFAICLQSEHSGDQVYVLEFFLSSINGQVRYWRDTLVLILDKIRLHFKKIKVAYGREEIGEILSVLVIDASSPDKVETICLPLIVVPSSPPKNLPTSLRGILHLTGTNNVNDYREDTHRGKSTRSHFLQRSIGESFTSDNENLYLFGANNVNDSHGEDRRLKKSTRPYYLQRSFGERFTSEANYDPMNGNMFELEMDGERYECVSDVDGRFSEEFRKYVREENLLCQRWNPEVLFWVSQKEHQPDVGVTSAYHLFIDKIDASLKNLDFLHRKCLLQFWQADEIVNSVDDHGERRFLFTTRNQPFLLWDHSLTYNNKQISEGICLYRMKTFDVIINTDGGGGAIGRVFKNKRMEFTPDISYYSTKEYPQQNIALSCHIKSSLVFPLSRSSGNVVGVIEFVSPSSDLLLYMKEFFSRTGGSDRCNGLCSQYDLGRDSLRKAESEIKYVIEKVCKYCAPEFAQTWMLCKHCNSLSARKLCAQELSSSDGVFSFGEKKSFLEVGCYCLLQQGEGVVGKATRPSHNMVYCEDVAKFSITDYPLAHFARRYNISACFAICLCSNLTGDHIYVLEFFLSSKSGEHRNLWEKLIPILVKMRECSQTFNVAYRKEEISDSVSVQVIDASSPDKVYTMRKGIASFNGANDARFFYGGLGESSTPYCLQRSIGASSTSETDDSMMGLETTFQDFSMEETIDSSASTVESKFRVTVKANYGDGFIWIPLSASSNINDLKQQVSQRMQLADGTYNLNYLDEDNDPVLLTCDEDLRYYISSLIKHENYSSMMFIEPKSHPMSS